MDTTSIVSDIAKIKEHISENHSSYQNIIFGLAKYDNQICEDMKRVVKKLTLNQMENTIRRVASIKPTYEIDYYMDGFYRAKIYGAMQRKMRSVFLLDDNYLKDNSGLLLTQN